MEAPYFDPVLHLFAIDVYLDGFEYQHAWAIDLQILYDNPDFIIDEEATEASQYSGFAAINADDFDLSTDEEINVKGNYSGSPSEAPEFTSHSHQFLFTIYFTATARSCANFAFDLTGIAVTFPPSSSIYPCNGDVGNDCEPEDVCLEGHTLSGLIEHPMIDCDGASNGGIPGVDVVVTESEDVEIFGCETVTDDYGEYECDVVDDLNYRIAPINEYDQGCGITSLDVDILFDHLLGTECMDYLWQWFAGDVNGNGSLEANDLVEMQKVIIDDPVEWLSWNFVPATTYNNLLLPNCPGTGYNVVPSFDPYIDVEDVNDDVSDLDFVGVKMGDLNATCTDCHGFTGEEEIWVRSAPVEIYLHQTNLNEFTLAFDKNIEGLKVFFLALNCDQAPEINFLQLENSDNFITRYADGVFYISYVSLKPTGENFLSDQPVLKFIGSMDDVSQGGNPIQNEIIYGNNYSRVELMINSSSLSKIYPNPTQNSITIEVSENTNFEKCTFLLYDILGNLVLSQTLTSLKSEVNFNLPSDVYLYTICTSTSSEFGKLIVQ